MADSTILAKAVVIQTQEEERYRLARLLQEGPAQLLANAALEIETCLQLMREQPDAARAGLAALLLELRQGSTTMRHLIAELQPPLLNELGLGASLQKYAADFSSRTGIAVDLVGWDALTERFPATVEMAIFRIVQDALDNVREHARASRVEVSLALTTDRLNLTVSDNGQGFAEGPGWKLMGQPSGFDAASGILQQRRLGFVAMHDRADLLGGTLQVFSEAGRGVRVVLSAPLRIRTAPDDRGEYEIPDCSSEEIHAA
jgi:two-component system sensor histidine kinase DegS